MDLKTLRVTFIGKVAWLEFTRPHQLNSFTDTQYLEFGQTLNILATHNSCSVCVVTGSGPFFSAGTDLGAMMRNPVTGSDDEILAHYMKMTDQQAKFVVRSMIDFPKPLIYAVNGGCIGFACTISQLSDIVYCSDNAYFETPFMKLAFCSEGCSSYTFPKVLGQSKANEMLLLGRKLSVQDAESTGFVAQVFPENIFKQEVLKRAMRMAEFSQSALMITKKLNRDLDRELLHQLNDEELKQLAIRFTTPECKKALMDFQKQQEMKRIQAKARRDAMKEEMKTNQEQEQLTTSLFSNPTSNSIHTAFKRHGVINGRSLQNDDSQHIAIPSRL